MGKLDSTKKNTALVETCQKEEMMRNLDDKENEFYQIMCTAKVLEEYENCKDISKPVKNLGIQVTRCDKDELPINDRKSTFLIVYLNDEQKAKTKRKGSSRCIYVK